jgi:CHAT domain-containing protein
MANDEILTLRDLFDLKLPGIRLAILSVCETGLPGTQLPDEVVSLPTGLLQAGVAGVVASL